MIEIGVETQRKKQKFQTIPVLNFPRKMMSWVEVKFECCCIAFQLQLKLARKNKVKKFLTLVSVNCLRDNL